MQAEFVILGGASTKVTIILRSMAPHISAIVINDALHVMPFLRYGVMKIQINLSVAISKVIIDDISTEKRHILPYAKHRKDVFQWSATYAILSW